MATLRENPRAGRDYPGDWNQFHDWFPNDTACEQYLIELRWPEGFVCTRCGESAQPYRLSRGRLMCRACRYQATVTAGTIFEKTRTPLRSWFAAAWYVTNQKNGVSALGLKRVLGLGSYQTAWSMLHRLRRAMVRPDRERLHGLVEVDDTVLGGPRSRTLHKPARWASRRYQVEEDKFKAIVAIAIEIHQPRGFGRVRLCRIADKSETSLLPFIRREIEPGSIIRSDGSFAYRSLADHGYRHDRKVLLGSGEPAHIALPGVHRIASLLKRWVLGTHQGSIQSHQLDYYLDEYTFRFNRRTSRARGMLFYRLLEQAVITKPTTYYEIAGI